MERGDELASFVPQPLARSHVIIDQIDQMCHKSLTSCYIFKRSKWTTKFSFSGPFPPTYKAYLNLQVIGFCWLCRSLYKLKVSKKCHLCANVMV